MGIHVSYILIHDALAAYRLGNLRDEVSAGDSVLSLASYTAALQEQEYDEKLKKCITLVYLIAEAVDMLVEEGKLDKEEFLSTLELLDKDKSIEIWGECSAFAKHIIDNQILKTRYVCRKCGHKNHDNRTKCIYCGNNLG
jgi:rubrerythrin